MRRLLAAAVAAGMFLTVAATTADACYCGAARYRTCRRACCPTVACPAPQQCYTVMKTCQKIVYEQKQVTCYRTVCEPVCERKTVEAVRYVPETQYRDCVQTVCKPVYETCEREVCYTVCKPVKTMQTVQVCGGHWETREVECAPPPCAPATCAPAACAPAACAPAVQKKVCKVWVPEMQQRQVECVRYVAETKTKKVPYTVCKMVPEQVVRKVPYTVCRPEKYQTTVSCVRFVSKQVAYTVTVCEPKCVTVQVPVQVCSPAACAPVSCCGG